MTAIVSSPQEVQQVMKSSTKKRKSKMSKEARLFINEKLSAHIVTNEIAVINDEKSKRQDFLNKGAESLIFSLIHLAKIEMGKLYVNPDTRSMCEEYMSDSYTALPVMTNNGQLSAMMYKKPYDIKDGKIVDNDEPQAAPTALPIKTKKPRKTSTIFDYRKRLEQVGFIEKTVHFARTNNRLIECEGARSGGYQLWINKKWFGLEMCDNKTNSLPDLAALPTPSNGVIFRDSVLSTSYSNFTIVKSLEKEDSESGVFPQSIEEKQVVVSAVAEIENGKGLASTGVADIAPPIAPAPPKLSPIPSLTATANKTAQDFTLFAQKLAKRIELDIYDHFQPKNQIKIGKEKNLLSPLTPKQRDRILDGCRNVLAYFAQKMPLADAFDEITEGVNETVKDLRRNKENFVYMPENWLCVAKNTEGVFRMRTGSLRYIIENWECREKSQAVKMAVNTTIHTIFDQYFYKLAKYGMEEHVFRKKLKYFAETGRLDFCKAAIDDFLYKVGTKKVTRDNKLAYLSVLWRDGKYGEKVEFDYNSVKHKKQEQAQMEKEYAFKQAKIKTDTQIEAEKAVKNSQKANSYAMDLDFAKRFAANKPIEFESILNNFARLKGLNMTTHNCWAAGLFPPYVEPQLVSTIKLQFPNEFL